MRNVTVILDPYYGDRIHPIAQASSVWVIASPANNAAHGRFAANSGSITWFQAVDPAACATNLVGLLRTLQDHHGEFEDDAYCFPKGFVLHAIGIALSEDLAAAFEDFGFSAFNPTAEGFEARV